MLPFVVTLYFVSDTISIAVIFFVLSFSNGTEDKVYTNTFTISSDSEGKITRIYNENTKKAIDVTYAG